MDRLLNLFRGNETENKEAETIVGNLADASTAQKFSMLTIISERKNKTEFFSKADEGKVNEFRARLQKSMNDEKLDKSAVCNIAFNKIRASLPAYLAKEIPENILSRPKDECDEKLDKLQQKIKFARKDGAEAAGEFSGLSLSVKLPLLGFALCGQYSKKIRDAAREFEKKKSEFAQTHGSHNMYAKGSMLGIEYKEGFISKILEKFPPDCKERFDVALADPDYESRKKKTLDLIEVLSRDSRFIADQDNAAKETDDGAHDSSLTSTTATITTTTTTNTTATTTTTASLPTITAAATTVAEENDDVDFHALIVAAQAYLDGGKEQNSYLFTLDPGIMSNETIADKMALYTKIFNRNRGQVQKKLYEEFKDDKDRFVSDVQIFCTAPLDTSQKVAFNRELSTVNGRNEHSENANYSVLGNDRAEMRTSVDARKPGNQLAFLMRVPMWNGTGNPETLTREQTASPLVLSVCAPALDFKSQPEWKEYVDHNGNLRDEDYGDGLSTISKQIIESVKANPDHEVVLSAFGMNNFISGLKIGDSHARATAIGVANMRKLITDLQAINIEVKYTDREKGSAFWQMVNGGISREIEYFGALPGKGLSSKVIIVNAWDPCSVIGNGCIFDTSIDGIIGRFSLVHESHVLLIQAFREGLLKAQALAPRV